MAKQTQQTKYGKTPKNTLLLRHIHNAGFNSYSSFSKAAKMHPTTVHYIASCDRYAGKKFFAACDELLNLNPTQMKYLKKKFSNPKFSK